MSRMVSWYSFRLKRKGCDILRNEWSLEARIRQLKIQQISLNDHLIAVRVELIDEMSEIQVAKAL